MAETCEDCGEDFDRLEQHIRMSDCRPKSTAVSDSSFGRMDETCTDCGASLRRCERLTAHPNLGGQLQFEAYVECDCSEHILGGQPVSINDLPEGWS